MSALPAAEASIKHSVVGEEVSTTAAQLWCDRCLDKPAARYCIDCGEKICANHLQFHDGFFEDLHKTIDIQAYAENPTDCVKVIVCKQHKNESITMACKRCYQFNCVQCELVKDSTEKDRLETAKSVLNERIGKSKTDLCPDYHHYQPLHQIQLNIKEGFKELLNNSSEEICKLEVEAEKAQNKMDFLQKQCNEMLDAVERKSTEQINFIRCQSLKLKEAIQKYQDEGTAQVNAFLSALMNKKSKVEKTKKDVLQFISCSQITDFVQLHSQKMRLLKKVISMKDENCQFVEHCLRIGKKREMEVVLTRVDRFPAFYSSDNLFSQGLSWDV